MSQYGSGGGYVQDSPQGSPSGGAPVKSDASQALRPMTIRQVVRADQAHTDASWTFESHEVGHISIVAQLLSINPQETNCLLTVDDGTGVMEARHWGTKSDDDTSTEWRGIRVNNYVRITGRIKTFGDAKKRFIHADGVTKCEDPYEPYFHMLEVMFIMRSLERPRDGSTASAGASHAVSRGGQPSSSVGDQYSGLPGLQKGIIKFMLEDGTGDADHGVSVGAIVSGMDGGGYNASEISDALDELMEHGHVYTTIDDAHFKVST